MPVHAQACHFHHLTSHCSTGPESCISGRAPRHLKPRSLCMGKSTSLGRETKHCCKPHLLSCSAANPYGRSGGTSVLTELVCGIGTSRHLRALIECVAAGKATVPAALVYARMVCRSVIYKLGLGHCKPYACMNSTGQSAFIRPQFPLVAAFPVMITLSANRKLQQGMTSGIGCPHQHDGQTWI